MFPENYAKTAGMQQDHTGLCAQLEHFNHQFTWLHVLQPYCTMDNIHKNSPQWWLIAFLQQLWNTTWELWHYQNGVVHQEASTATTRHLLSHVQEEYAKGTASDATTIWSPLGRQAPWSSCQMTNGRFGQLVSHGPGNLTMGKCKHQSSQPPPSE